MSKLFVVVLLTSLSIPSYAWFWSKEEWTGIVYPNRENLFRHKVIGVYKDLNTCLKEANSEAGSEGSYECGLNCDTSKSPMVCEKTVGNEK